jgi:hypothetical protein
MKRDNLKSTELNINDIELTSNGMLKLPKNLQKSFDKISPIEIIGLVMPCNDSNCDNTNTGCH